MTPHTPITISTDERLTPRALRSILLEAGTDDCGVVSIDAPGLDGEREHILRHLPWARTLAAFVVRMNREPIRATARSIANSEFHETGREVNDIARRAVRALESAGVRAIAPPMAFPMEMDDWPGRLWVIAHKVVAEAAGMGVMGLHRVVIHPEFGSAILLGTIVLGAELDSEDGIGKPIDFNPCFECRLCVAACPTGAIKPDGAFDFASCYTHNYREFMSGFADWVETVADAGSTKDYRRRVEDHETVSMWQSLGFGPNYKAAYCVAVCPAGEDVIGPFRKDKARFINEVVRPLQDKEETVYAIKGSDAHGHVAGRFRKKTIKTVSSGLRPTTARGFVEFLPNLFQRGAARGLDATYHFVFTGRESLSVTIRIVDGALTIHDGLVGKPDLRMTADAEAWVAFVRGDKGLLGPLLTRRMRLKGDPRLLLRFGACFPT